MDPIQQVGIARSLSPPLNRPHAYVCSYRKAGTRRPRRQRSNSSARSNFHFHVSGRILVSLAICLLVLSSEVVSTPARSPFNALAKTSKSTIGTTGTDSSQSQSNSDPTNLLYEVPINISNSQNSPTPAPFQQMVQVNTSSYASIEAPNLQNVEFLCTNGTVIPSWLESGSNRSTDSIYWLKLPKGIQAASNLVIYMGFASTSTNLFDGTTVGENPQLSPTYGEYDNGANVFGFYDNFAGTTLNPHWNDYGSNTVKGTSSLIQVNNGLALKGTTEGNWTWLAATNTPAAEYRQGVIADFSLASGDPGMLNNQTYELAPLFGFENTFPNNFCQGYGAGFQIVWGPEEPLSNINVVYGGSGSTNPPSCNSFGYTSLPIKVTSIPPLNGFNVFSVVTSNSSVSFQINGNPTNPGMIAITPPSPTGGVFLASDLNATLIANWVRVRSIPPNGIMPSASIVASSLIVISPPQNVTTGEIGNVVFWAKNLTLTARASSSSPNTVLVTIPTTQAPLIANNLQIGIFSTSGSYALSKASGGEQVSYPANSRANVGDLLIAVNATSTAQLQNNPTSNSVTISSSTINVDDASQSPRIDSIIGKLLDAIGNYTDAVQVFNYVTGTAEICAGFCDIGFPGSIPFVGLPIGPLCGPFTIVGPRPCSSPGITDEVLSPASLLASVSGRYIGTFPNGTEVNQIPGGWYSGSNTEPQFMWLPPPTTLSEQITLTGTDFGTVRFTSESVSTNGLSGNNFTYNTFPGEILQTSIALTTNSSSTHPSAIGTLSREPDENGWYNHPVSATWTGVENGTIGTGSCDPQSAYSGPDGRSVLLTGRCTDISGNVGTGSVTFNYDSTPPIVTSPQEGSTYFLNESVAPLFTYDDAVSGIASCTVSGQTITSQTCSAFLSNQSLNTSTVGLHSYTITATDVAGNVVMLAVNYGVISSSSSGAGGGSGPREM